MKWGVRRYQKSNGSLTSEGISRYKTLSKRKAKKEAKKDYFEYKKNLETDYDYRQANKYYQKVMDYKRESAKRSISEKRKLNNDYNSQISKMEKWDRKHKILDSNVLNEFKKSMVLGTIGKVAVTAWYAHQLGLDRYIANKTLSKLENNLNTYRAKKAAEEAIPKIADYTVDYFSNQFSIIDDKILGRAR